MIDRARVLVLAVGNPSRGDDALGPELAARLEAAALHGVEVINEFQLQVENALDLEGRELVVFVDAGMGTPPPFELREARAHADFIHTTHAISPESVLATYARVQGREPPRALVLCVRGESFELGEPLSPAGAANLEAAWPRLVELCSRGAPAGRTGILGPVTPHPTVPLVPAPARPEAQMLRAAREFHEFMQRRRTVREFDARPVPREIIAECIAAAGTAPSGANQQPWHFVAVSDPAVKHRIRAAAEEEERQFYARRASEEWLAALEPLGTDWQKPFLETAPWLIAIFAQKWRRTPDGAKVKYYYPTESVGIATGMLITALHTAGLATLTHTPSPMGFLNEILGRPPDSERPFLLLVAGYPAADARVPDISRKPTEATCSWFVPG